MALRRFPALLLAALLAGTAARGADDPLLLSLLEAKKAYKEKRWDDAEAALRRLLELAAAPEREPVLTRILPPYHFYAAAVAWEKKDEERARQELARYFEYQPEAAIDPGAYPKSYCIFFDAQRTAAERRNPAPPPAGLSDIAMTLPDAGTIPQYTGDPAWPASAAGFLLTDSEKKEFAGLGDDATRRDWVFRFWKGFDPDPETPENEFEVEFYRRVQYAEAHFSTETVRGSLSDRGRVLIVLGPPTSVGHAPLLPSGDTMSYLQSTQTTVVRSRGGGATIERLPTGAPSGMTGADAQGDVEIWTYRKGRLPEGVPFRELRFRFITREGYGVGVFQKDARELLALQKAARHLRTGGS